DCELHHVDFINRNCKSEHWLVRTWQGTDGAWTAHPIGGGSGEEPFRSRPWVNFAAAWGAERFAAGGPVIGQGAEAAHLVRLAFADGATIEDVVDNGIVLFHASPGVTFPARVEVFSEAGEVLAEYREFAEVD